MWATHSGKAEFSVFAGVEEDEAEQEVGTLWLTTMRSHDQYNTTLYSLSDRYRGIFGGRMMIFLSEAEMIRRDLQAGDRVALETVSGDGVKRRVEGFKVVPYALPEGCVGAYYPEANPLVPLSLRDPQSHTPAYKGVPVRIRAMPAEAAA